MPRVSVRAVAVVLWVYCMHAGPPTSCSPSPTAPLSNGSWPVSCAGAAIGAICTGNCTYGGAPTVTCQASGLWDAAATGACAGVLLLADAVTQFASLPQLRIRSSWVKGPGEGREGARGRQGPGTRRGRGKGLELSRSDTIVRTAGWVSSHDDVTVAQEVCTGYCRHWLNELTLQSHHSCMHLVSSGQCRNIPLAHANTIAAC